ncbi:MAG: RNA polymerase subunit sigma-70 [Actinomycetota bacterium]|nr:RNA polymerase subunit sigma-70 [Actinomycetota bacterium]
MREGRVVIDDVAALRQSGRPDDDSAAAVIAGDEAAFAAVAARHRRELHVHCYRMLASFEEAEDAVQETFLRAWRARERLAPDTQLRAWLYRVATNVCLDALRRRDRRPKPATPIDVPWMTPYPDTLLDELTNDGDDEPGAVVVRRETIELGFLAALQVLPPRQRAAWIARDVLGWSAAETAATLGTSVAAANSALRRARATMRALLPATRAEWSAAAPTAAERELLDRFIDAHERCDAEAALAVAARDIRVTMPPYPWVHVGIAELTPLLVRGLGPDRDGDWRLLPTAVNRMPAAGSYLRRAGDTVFRPFKLDVLRVRGAEIAEITTFGPAPFDALGLPPSL